MRNVYVPAEGEEVHHKLASCFDIFVCILLVVMNQRPRMKRVIRIAESCELFFKFKLLTVEVILVAFMENHADNIVAGVGRLVVEIPRLIDVDVERLRVGAELIGLSEHEDVSFTVYFVFRHSSAVQHLFRHRPGISPRALISLSMLSSHSEYDTISFSSRPLSLKALR